MKRRIALKLARELESGKWKKARAKLGRGQRQRCCLGVLQEIAPSRLPRSSLIEYYPSEAVIEWAGMRLDEAADLAEMNDQERGWAEIIKLLRETK